MSGGHYHHTKRGYYCRSKMQSSECKMLKEAWERTRREMKKNLHENVFADDWKLPPPIHWTLKDRIRAAWDILLGKRDPYE